MGRTLLLVLDAGGGGAHAVVVDATGTVVRAHRPWHHPSAPETGGLGVDLDLTCVWTAVVDAARDALGRAAAAPGEVAAVAATGMRHTTVVLDGAGRAVFATPNRDARAFVETLEALDPPPAVLYDATGHWPSPIATAMRWRWLARQRPDAARGASALLSLNDWIALQLCGQRATDASQACETLLLDLRSRSWSGPALDRFEVPRAVLPPLVEPGTSLGGLLPDAARALGLSPGTPVVVAGADTQCGTLGAGALEPGATVAVGGTTMPVQMVLDRPQLDPERRIWTCCFLRADRWVLESNAGPVGETLDWFARVMAPDAAAPIPRLLAEAARSAPGAVGGFSTLGGTIMDARALHIPLGHLTFSHLPTANDPGRRDHVARAVVEGMAYAVRANLDQLRGVTTRDPDRVCFAGGLARSTTFAAVLAGALDRPVARGHAFDATAVGAAICAGVGAGVFRDLADGVRALAAATDLLEPRAEHARAYAGGYETWRRLRAAEEPARTLARDAVLPAMLAAFERDRTVVAAPSRRPRILVTADLDESALDALRAIGEVEYASFRQTMRLLGGDTLVDALRGVAVLVTEVDLVDAAVLRRAESLRVVVACRGDAVNVDVAACSAFGVPVLHAPGRNADAVADLTLAFLLMLARKLDHATAFLRQPGIEAGDMGRMGQAFTQLRAHELWGKTIGLVGLGAVGRAVARRLAGFGARLLVADPYVTAEDAALVDAEVAALPDVLAASDFVSLHAPLTGATRGMIGAAELARMKPGAFLVNTARAGLVDETALLDALRGGRLGGAALDVFPVEPPGSDHPLLQLATVIATPHVGGNTVEVGAHQGRIVVDEIRRLVRGERPAHAVDASVLDGFSWDAPRRVPDEAVLAQLASRPAPAVTDLAQHRRARPPTPAASAPAAATAPADVVERMQRVLEGFLARAGADDALQAFAAGKDVTLHFTLPDVGRDFFLRLRDGRAGGGLGHPEGDADVELRMRAEVLDGMFMGTLNPMQAATGGRIAFTGDTMKAMTLQQIQPDLSRCYRAAREEVGGPGDLASVPDTTPGARAAAPAAPDDVRREILAVVHELYASGLVTATGGNVSARVPGKDEIWITPSQAFKGELTADMLVRIDLDGRPLDPGAPAPSSERLMHCAAYRARPDAQAVIHAHAPHATILVNAGLPFLPVSTEAAFFGDVPRIPFVMPGTQELADAVGAALAHGWAVFMQNHGLLVAGRSLRRAADMVEVIDRSCEVILGCHQAGRPPSVLPPDVVAMLQAMGDMMA
jgi:autoinducer 2 (AI-2) kinase